MPITCTQSDPRASSPSTIPSTATNTILGPIVDICTTLYQVDTAEKGIGFLTDDGAIKHYLYLVKSNMGANIRTVSLDDLLSSTQLSSSAFLLARGDRLHIAVTLASSVLQLDRTSWLKTQWRSSDIFFHMEGEFASMTSKQCFKHPYLSWKLSSMGEEQDHPTESSALKIQVVRSEPLFALGLALTELCFGKNLSEMQRPEEIDSNETLTRLNTAHRLLGDVYNESGGRYGDVVRRCLFCLFDMRDVSLDNEDFQDAVYDNIVSPLIQDLETFKGAGSMT